MYAFTKKLQRLEHTLHYSVTITDAGWELREERDSQLVRQAHFHDWHRVERATRTIAIELDDLRTKGWSDA
jgi:hypothetical protein